MARHNGRSDALEQLDMDLGPPRPRWKFSRLAQHSPHHVRIRERLEFVRGFFPEIESLTIRVGLARRRGILGWGSLDPDQPGVWVRPRRLDRFTIAHEFTHLLQARGLVPLGERACDLWALARSPLLVDHPPGYLDLPAALRRVRSLDHSQARLLNEAARRAIAARERGERRYIRMFEREVADAMSGCHPVSPMERTKHSETAQASRMRVVAAVVFQDDLVLLTRRPPGGPLGLLWEFPGGKVEPGETPERALVREIAEELGVAATPFGTLAVETFDYPDGPAVEIAFICCSLDSLDLKPGPGVHEIRWWRRDELEPRTALAADRAFLERLKSGSEGRPG